MPCTITRAAIAAMTVVIPSTAALAGVDSFTIGLEEVVSDGVPGPGAGNLETETAVDVYTFNAPAGTLVYFDELSGSCGIHWECVDSLNTVLFENNAICVTNPGVHELTLGGDYTITVDSPGGTMGTYSFIVWDLNRVEEFTIALDEVVSDGAPGVGAGNIEEPGAVDRYFVDIPAGSFIYFDEQGGPCSLDWSCWDPNGDPVFEGNAICVTDPDLIELPIGGTYTIEVDGPAGGTGTYGFSLVTPEPPDQFTIGLEETVADGVQGAGSGHIEEAGTSDIYGLNVTAGTEVYFDELSGPCGIRWSVVSPSGVTLFQNNAICVTDPQIYTLDEDGFYTITVDGQGDATGTYSFIVWELNPPDVFEIQLGDVVEDGFPGPGAGNIEEAGTIDVYTFEGTSGDEICVEEFSGSCGIAWMLQDPNGDAVFDDNAICVTDPGIFTLPLDGTYTVTVDGIQSNTGAYSFVINTAKLADFDGNCLVNVADLLILLTEWG